MATAKSNFDDSDFKPDAVASNNTSVPFEDSDFIPDKRSFLSKLAPNVIAGLAEGGHNILNAPHNIVNMVSPSLASHIPTQQDYDYPKLVGLDEPATLSDKIIRGLAQYAPAAVIPEAEAAELPLGASLGAKASAFGNRVQSNALRQGLYGATQNSNPVVGLGFGALGGAAGTVAGSAVNSLRPSRIFRGNLSPEELLANQEATEGTQTNLGRVIGSPTLNRLYENILPHIMGSGTEDTMQNTANVITQKGNNILENIRGNTQPGNYGGQLQEALKKAANDARKEKNSNYKKVNDIADKEDITVGRNNFQQAAADALKNINQSSELKAELPNEIPSSLKRYISNLSPEETPSPSLIQGNENYSKMKNGLIVPSDFKDLLNQSIEPEGNSFKLSNIFKGKLNDKANEYYQNGQMYEYGIMKSLKNGLDSDIKESIDNSKSQEFKDAYNTSQKNYAEKFAPFEDPEIVKFTRQGGDPDLLLPYFLRGGKNDRATLLTKLTSKLSENTKHVPLYSYLSKSIDESGNVNPIKLNSLYQNLGKNQKNVLITDNSIKNQLDNYSNLVNKNKESFNLMFNPKTGARNTDVLIKLAQAAGGTAAGGFPGFLASMIVPGIASRGINSLLTAPSLREKLINSMIKNKNISIPGLNSTGGAIQNVMSSNDKNNTNNKKSLMKLNLNNFAGYQHDNS